MTFSTLLIGDRTWLLPVAAVLVAALLILWRAYRKVSVTGRVRMAACLLKAAGIALLAIFLVDPLWSSTRALPGANIFVLLVDNSRSLSIHDAGEKQSRGERLKPLVADHKSSWQVRLAQDFDVRRYLFETRLRRSDDFSELDFSGTGTSLGRALQTLCERFRGRPLGGLLIFTDGNATDLNLASFDTDGLPPIYSVVIGGPEDVKDIAIESVAISKTSFEDAPITIRADVTAVGYEETEIVAELLDEDAKSVRRKSLTTADEDQSLSFRFKLRPPKPGISFYRVRVSAAAEHDQFEHPERTNEVTLENNVRLITFESGKGPHRILYVAGRPNWEFKFLNRALQADSEIELASLIRIAKREAKFDFRGRVGESSNPLYRGFKKKGDEETERYDEPVFVRLNMKNKAELRDGFPKAEKDLFGFHAVILDDVEAAFFTHDQMALLERFVSERGGGLLMLGGQESFRNGGYRRTPIDNILPVYLDRPAEQQPQTRYRLSLTRDGWLQPWVRLRGNQADESQRLNEMPGFRTLNRLGAVKPGATVMAHATDDAGQQLPALVVQRFGRGRCAALTIGDMWRWQLKREDAAKNDLAKAWRQMLRWLVADVPQQIELETTPSTEPSTDAVQLRVKAHDEEFQPLDNAMVQITVQPPAGKPVVLEAEPSLKDPGLYEAMYVPRTAGAYRAFATATRGDGKQAGHAVTGWVTDPAADEFRSVIPNRTLMEQLARKTGGEIIDANNLDGFAESLSARKVPITQQWTFPLWHQSWVFLLAVGCLIGEWGLRRWKGLP